MLRPGLSLTLCGLLLSAVAGCGCHAQSCRGTATVESAGAVGAPSLSLSRRAPSAPIEPGAAAPLTAEDHGKYGLAEAVEYRELTPERCQCLAAANSTLGNLLAEEGSLAASANGGHTTVAETSAKRAVLACRAVEERNRSAAAALRAYYALAEAETNRDWLAKALAEANRAVENLDRLKAQGLAVPAEGRLFQQQRVELLDKDAQLRNGIDGLNAQLRTLLGLDDRSPLWPATDLDVSGDATDEDEAVRVGLANRPDLAMLRSMGATHDGDALPALRSGLQQIDPLLGGAARTTGLLLRRAREANDAREAQSRQGQLSRLAADRRRAAVEEIRQKARTLDTRARQAMLAEEARKLRQQQLERLTEKRAADGVTVFEVSKARIELFRAESDLVSAAAAWKIARVELRESQGLLARECGYCLPASCDQPCR